MATISSILIALGSLFVIGLLIYLIAQRMKEKENEKFEKRDY